MFKERIYWPDSFGTSITLSDKAVVHKIKDVCRLKKDEPLYLFDGKGQEVRYFIEKVSRTTVAVVKDKSERKQDQPKKRIYLGFPLVREERIDFILQKCVELGVFGFVPFISERSINKFPSINKVNRWQKIATEAARQSDRLWLPKIEETIKFNDLILRSYALKIAGSVDGKIIKQDITPAEGDVLIVVGPVGDFSPQEYSALANNNFKFIKLAPDILRVETAAVFAAGLVNYFIMRE
ncbi:MAG: RsmE family RNA methyltransferase [Candidatus Omnitrophota bacterium]|nr:16S rRNA (uracil(1498)-N(3))-methyltransferase [Candidatus Omnitrophota bacterium]